MFTGIIEATGIVKEVVSEQGNLHILVQSAVSEQLKIDQSVSHNGICLTVDELGGDKHRVTAIGETILKTTVGHWQAGDLINLERCMEFNGRLDGHMVQGHVDTTAICTNIVDKNGSWEYTFSYPAEFAHLIIEKGSVCINGISLTAFNLHQNFFTVAIIPYTYEHTNMKYLLKDMAVNIEFDVVGKYISRIASLKN